MMRHGSLRSWLILLALVAIIPFLALHAFTTYQVWQERQDRAEADALNNVQFQAEKIDNHLRAIDEILSVIGVLISTDPADIEANDALLQKVKATLPSYYSGLAVVDPQGRNIGFGVPAEVVGRQVNVSDRAYFQAALRTRATVIGDPVVSRSTGAQIIPVARATRSPNGEVRAIVLVAIGLDYIQTFLGTEELPAQSVVTLVTSDGVVLARSLDPAAWVGQNISTSPSVKEVLERREGLSMHRSADGIERVAAFTALQEAPWLIYVGIPAQVVFQPVQAALLRDSLLLILSLLLTLLFATLMAERIARPLTHLAADAVAFGSGDLRRRTMVRVNAEIGVLARSFNQMAESIARDITARVEAEDALRRHSTQLQHLAHAAQRIQVAPDAAALSQRVTAEALALIDAQQAVTSITTATADGGIISTTAGSTHSSGPHHDPTPAGMHILAAHVCTTNQPLRLTADDPLDQSLSAYMTELTAHSTIHTWMAVPLIGRDGRNLGVIQLINKQEGVFNADDEALLVQLAQLAATVLEQQFLYAEEQHARSAAEHAVQLRDQFLSIASHELRTPLTSVLAHAQVFQRRALHEGTLNERDQRSLQQVITHAGRLNRMIGAMLDVSRIDQGRLQLDCKPLDLAALVHEVVAGLQGTSTHQLLVTGEQAGLWVAGDGLRLEQVLQNLLGNAIKYSPECNQVKVQLASDNTTVQVTVYDQGIGIPAADIPYIFNRFYRAANVSADTITGVGIGLFVVQEIVELHSGTITLTSEEGVGSSFCVTLPRIAAPEANKPEF